MMTYKETTDYIFNRLPLFQMVGSSAYKIGLDSMKAFDDRLGNPHKEFKCIHVGGTNGKGSCSHTIASILQSAGFKVGLFTSPHLKDFRERIRVNGEMVSEEFVVAFVEKHKAFFDEVYPSFFEVNVAMAFDYFRQEKVDFAVVEVGLGGRLDSTNIISPILSVITNISMDHMNILGDTEVKIATEKAGIIKKNTPVVIGEAEGAVKDIFIKTAENVGAPIHFAEEYKCIWHHERIDEKGQPLQGLLFDDEMIETPLMGIYQLKNMATVKSAIRQLRLQGIRISKQAEWNGYRETISQTHLLGRWQKIGEHPTIICDTGHNVGGIQYVVRQLERTPHDQLHIVFGMVGDKDESHVLELLPKDAKYYFPRASIRRAMNEKTLQEKGAACGLDGDSFSSAPKALEAAKKNASPSDLIYVGGSTYLVAEII